MKKVTTRDLRRASICRCFVFASGLMLLFSCCFLHSGEKLPENLALRQLNGEAVVFPLKESKKTIFIFIMSKQCPVCDKNFYWWKLLASRYKNTGFFYGVAMSTLPTPTILRATGLQELNFSVYLPLNRKLFNEQFSVLLDESKIIIINDGKVVFCKDGELTAGDYHEIKKTLSLSG